MTRTSSRVSAVYAKTSAGSDYGSVPPSFRVKRPRHRTTAYQLSELEGLFNVNPSPSVPIKAELAKKLGMELKVVNIWFQNKRQTTKRKMLEMGEIEKGESPFENTNKEPLRRQPLRQSALRRPTSLNRGFKSAASDGQQDDVHAEMDESGDEQPLKIRTSPAVSNIVNHMVSSSSDSSLCRRRAAILANFGPGNSRLEWACAKNYVNFSSERRRKKSQDPSGPSKVDRYDNCDCCAKRCDCSGSVTASDSETDDDDHEAITPDSVVIPLPNIVGEKFGNLTSVAFWGSGYGSTYATSVSEMTEKELEAAHTLLELSSGPKGNQRLHNLNI